MKKIIPNSILLLFTSLILISCSGNDLENINSADANAQLVNAFIYDSELVGEWEVDAMITDREIDLNGDGESNYDLLSESSCFDKMVYTFKGDKTFTIINPILELTSREDEDEFNCQSPNTITGKWSIKDDNLILYIKRNNVEYQEKKHLILLENHFYLEINNNESKEFINDKGNSSVSGLSVVALEFKRTSKKL